MTDHAVLESDVQKRPLFGIEFIWQLEDCYEQKDLNGFSSLVSRDFKKGIGSLKNRLEQEFNEYELVKLFMHLRSKQLDLETGIHAYEICWSKRRRRYCSIFLEKNSGNATIVLKRLAYARQGHFLLYDILGDNPFVDTFGGAKPRYL